MERRLDRVVPPPMARDVDVSTIPDDIREAYDLTDPGDDAA